MFCIRSVINCSFYFMVLLFLIRVFIVEFFQQYKWFGFYSTVHSCLYIFLSYVLCLGPALWNLVLFYETMWISLLTDLLTYLRLPSQPQNGTICTAWWHDYKGVNVNNLPMVVYSPASGRRSSAGQKRCVKYSKLGGSVAERLACWTQAQKGPGSYRSRVTVLGKLFTPIVPLFTKQRNW